MWIEPRNLTVKDVLVILKKDVGFYVGDKWIEVQGRRYNIKQLCQHTEGMILGELNGLDIIIHNKTEYERVYPLTAGSVRCMSGQINAFVDADEMGVCFYELNVESEKIL